MDDAMRRMTLAEVRGEATEEERNWLRLDENVEAWSDCITHILGELSTERSRMKAEHLRREVDAMKSGDKLLLREVQANYMERVSRHLRLRDELKKLRVKARGRVVKYHRRRKEQEREARAREHEALLERQKKASEKASNDKLLKHVRKLEEDRNCYRLFILNEVEAFLEVEEHFNPEHLSAKEQLKARLHKVMFSDQAQA